MLRTALVVWIVGLLTAVPYAVYYLLFVAPKEQYALLITFVLFWIFGYWGLAGPLLSLIKVRAVFRAIEASRSREAFIDVLRSADARDVAVDHIASEYGIPRFLAVRVLNLVVDRLAAAHTPSAVPPDKTR